MSDNTCVTKVQVEVTKMLFNVTFTPLGLGDVKSEVEGAIYYQTRNQHALIEFSPANCFPYFLLASDSELTDLHPELGTPLTQVESRQSLLFRNENAYYWKYSPYYTVCFANIVAIAIQFLSLGRSYLHYSLLPIGQKNFGKLLFYQYEVLIPPLKRVEAKDCLKPLLDGVKNALDELHAKDIAHVDVHLPNICFTPGNHTVMLIDLDRCEKANAEHTASLLYKDSELYHIPQDWKWKQLDWRAVGFIICWVLDARVQKYSTISSSVDPSIRSNNFIKCLLDEGKLGACSTRVCSHAHIVRDLTS